MSTRNYYYFVATLPSLNFGEKPYKSSSEFVEDSHALLHPDDFDLFKYCCFDPRMAVETTEPTGSDFTDLFLARERTLVLNLAYLRAIKLNWPSPGDPPHDFPRFEAVAKAAFEMEDPFQATLSIDRARWGVLDTMVGAEDIFGINNILVHFIKLQLMERKQRFDHKKGLEIYQERYKTILEEYNSRVQRG